MATRSQSAVFAALLTVWLPVVSRVSADQDAAASTLMPTAPAGEKQTTLIFSCEIFASVAAS